MKTLLNSAVTLRELPFLVNQRAVSFILPLLLILPSYKIFTAASIDLYSFAWTANPLVNAFIEESGTATSFFNPAPLNNTAAWYSAVQILKCGDQSTPIATTLSCMRTQPFQALLKASVSTGVTALIGNFAPTIDNKTVFSDYSLRASNRQYIHKPYLIGNNDYEAGTFKLTAKAANLTLSDQFWAIFNLAFFSCPAEAAARPRTNAVSTYRYRFFGDYPNTRITLNPDSGAWHGAEIPIIWRTTQDATNVANIPVEALVSNNLNAAWAAFAKDPASALSKAPFSWPQYKEGANTLIRLGYDNETSASYIDPVTYDEACSTLREIFTSLPGPLTSILTANPSVFAPLAQFQNLTEMGGGSEVGY